jgi:hypothetical protein
MRDADCAGGYVCDQEQRMSTPVPGAPGGSVDLVLFPGGSCTPKRLTSYDATGSGLSCDPLEPTGSQGCGEDGVCDGIARGASGATLVGCRKSCDPIANETGCPAGYECTYTSKSCNEGCQTDAECRVKSVDSDGDGEADALMYDSASTITCDTKSARCVHAPGPQATGTKCESDSECSKDSACIGSEAVLAGVSFPDGQCTRPGCQYEGRECDSGTVCEPLRPVFGDTRTAPLCLTRCKVGAEGADLRVGAKGHGMGCRDGYRCHYNGAGSDGGVCVGGNYNDVTKNNVGAACKSDADCYSPFGLGTCQQFQLTASDPVAGICSIIDCAAPGMPKDLCGEGNECVAVSAGGDSDESSCDHHCKDATECPAGFACTDDDGVAATPKTCIPPCRTDMDCRSGEKCTVVGTTASGNQIALCRLQ